MSNLFFFCLINVICLEKMPKYYCDYCDAFLTHDSPSVRKTHNSGRKHKENVRHFYQAWMEEQAQKLIDATTKAFTTQRMMAPNMIPPIAPAGMMPRPFLMPPMGMLRPPIMPPNSSGFFMPPVPTTGFSIANPGMPAGMPRIPIPHMPMPPTTTGSGGESGGQPQLRTQIKMQPPE
ncbi:unnamed protein product [Meloidogyne enterolobii]|uniref:Uncharacterized protein n=1 Tax=Meloidogyne enterolobii TaxID=390850 RepID=A0ACB0YKV0_MELEN